MKIKIIFTIIIFIILSCHSVLRNDSVERGKALFEDPSFSVNGDIACATCHPDNANTDRMNHDIGLGRSWDTHSLWEVANTEPYLWGGEWTLGLKELTRHVFTNVMGSPTTLTEQQLDDIVAYMRTIRAPLSPFLNTDGSLTDLQLQGKALFEDVNRGDCARCHGGEFMTSPEKYFVDEFAPDKVTIIPGPEINPPTLLGMWDTAPYWRNGKFKTIREVIDGHPWIIGPQNTIDPPFSENEKRALEAYLNAL